VISSVIAGLLAAAEESLMHAKEKLLAVTLAMGMAVPLFYFGIQLVAAPFYPGYSFVAHAASELGSPQSLQPDIFNGGAMLLGVVTLLSAYGFLRGLQRIGTNVVLAWLVAIGVVLNGLGSLWAGIYPLPEPRHGSNPFTAGILLLPVLLTIALWKQRDARGLKTYLILANMVFVAMVPIMSGMVSIDRGGYAGLLQRITTLAVFPPVGVAAYFLARRGKAADHTLPADRSLEQLGSR
jgi:hypothetical membrane protein